jgi:hypothetical protein
VEEACAVCGAREVTTYRRWPGTPVRPALFAGALATVVFGAVTGSGPWIAGGALALTAGLLVHKLGVLWWGGRRCRACGDEAMLR